MNEAKAIESFNKLKAPDYITKIELDQYEKIVMWCADVGNHSLAVDIAKTLCKKVVNYNITVKNDVYWQENLTEFLKLAREIAEIGLKLAKHYQDNDLQILFSDYIFRLSYVPVNDWQKRLEALLQKRDLVSVDQEKWIAYDLSILGKDAAMEEDFLTSHLALNTVLEICTQLDYKIGIAEAHLRLGLVHFKQQQLDLAYQSFQQAIEIAHQNEFTATVINSMIGIGKIYQQEKQLDLAKDMFTEALKLANEDKYDIWRDELNDLLINM